jgi:Zn-dependent protease
MHNNSFPFTRDAQLALTNANKIAKEHGRSCIDSDLLLLGVLRLAGSQAEQVLTAMRIKVSNLITRLAATIALESRDNEFEPGPSVTIGNTVFSTDSATILAEALSESQQEGVDFVDPRLLMLGMLRCPNSKAGRYLAQFGVELEAFRKSASLKDAPPTNAPRVVMPRLSLASTFGGVSIVFIALVLVTALAGWLLYAGIGNVQALMVVFVMGGWVTSVALHEFGHALVAYRGGDDSVVDKGYLTLNPILYTNPLLSIVLPLIFLVMGGIGLPGGAVYINDSAIRSPGMRSLTSAAGPIATALCAGVLALPFVFLERIGYETVYLHQDFWAILAFLIFLQITAIFINMLPIPGLDGFGILYPYLPANIANMADFVRPFGTLILFALLFTDSPLQDLFWQEVWMLTMRISPELALMAIEGMELFHFW